jgi:hypothetical protein
MATHHSAELNQTRIAQYYSCTAVVASRPTPSRCAGRNDCLIYQARPNRHNHSPQSRRESCCMLLLRSWVLSWVAFGMWCLQVGQSLPLSGRPAGPAMGLGHQRAAQAPTRARQPIGRWRRPQKQADFTMRATSHVEDHSSIHRSAFSIGNSRMATCLQLAVPVREYGCNLYGQKARATATARISYRYSRTRTVQAPVLLLRAE